jgi:hypothetical protein
MRQGPPKLRTSILARQYYRLFEGYLRFGEELWGRSWTIASGSLRRAVEQVERGSLGLQSSEALFRSLLDEYANFMLEMGAAWPLAAEMASSRVRSTRPMGHNKGMEDEVPVTSGSGVTQEVPVQGGDGPSRPLALPVRFIDASQGWAAYVVSSGIATEMLGESTDMVMPFDVGGGRALVVVMGIDYRACDLGCYQELALALIVTAKSDPAGIPGAMFLGIGVNGEFSRDAGKAVWGLEKVFSEDLSVTYRADTVAFGLRSGHPETLSIGFPRFGSRRFHAIPTVIHSRRSLGHGHREEPLQSLMSLNGHGSGVQVGGSVLVRLGSIDRGACICRGSTEACLCNRLRRLDVTDRLPAANGWTEHLSGIFEAPRTLRPVAE